MRLVKGVWKKMPQLGIKPQTSHFPGKCANRYTTVTALSTLPYTVQVVLKCLSRNTWQLHRWY